MCDMETAVSKEEELFFNSIPVMSVEQAKAEFLAMLEQCDREIAQGKFYTLEESKAMIRGKRGL